MLEKEPQLNTAEKEQGLENLWSLIEEKIKNFYNETNKPKDMEQDEIEEWQEKVEKRVQKEIFFFFEVYKSISTSYKENSDKNHKLLFDIDQTIGTSRRDENYHNIGTILRPCLMPLLEHIKKEFPELKIGFLSTRSQKGIKEQMQDKNELGYLESHIDENSIFSIDQLEDEDFYLDWNEEKISNYIKKHPCADQNKIPNDSNEWVYELIDGQNMGKLEMLRKIKSQNPETILVSVDDTKFPKYLKNGVSLAEKGGFWI
tara:strand:- start:52 stop:828 length:777 start_codon:yes stop_codon:yes gene_type:complete